MSKARSPSWQKKVTSYRNPIGTSLMKLSNEDLVLTESPNYGLDAVYRERKHEFSADAEVSLR